MLCEHLYDNFTVTDFIFHIDIYCTNAHVTLMLYNSHKMHRVYLFSMFLYEKSIVFTKSVWLSPIFLTSLVG